MIGMGPNTQRDYTTTFEMYFTLNYSSSVAIGYPWWWDVFRRAEDVASALFWFSLLKSLRYFQYVYFQLFHVRSNLSCEFLFYVASWKSKWWYLLLNSLPITSKKSPIGLIKRAHSCVMYFNVMFEMIHEEGALHWKTETHELSEPEYSVIFLFFTK